MSTAKFWSPIHVAETLKGRLIPAAGRDADSEIFTGISIDTRTLRAGEAYLAIKGETHDGHDFIGDAVERGASLIIARDTEEKRVPIIIVHDPRGALTDMARAWRAEIERVKTIAITGSAGKTTTKEMVHEVLKAGARGTASPRSFNNDLGVPLTILGARPDDDYLITELGTNAPGEIGALAALARPDIAIITNIGRSHLAGLGSVEGVAREKAALLGALRASGLAIVHADSPAIHAHLEGVSNLIRFGFDETADVRVVNCEVTEEGSSFTLADGSSWRVSLPGRHQVANALPAIILGRHFGIDDVTINRALGQVGAASMRFEREIIGGITIHNDAYNANPDSMAASIETFHGITPDDSARVLILGDMLELGGHESLAHAALGEFIAALHKQHPFRGVILLGEAVVETAAVLRDHAPDLCLNHYSSVTRADFEETARVLRPGDHVLLKASRGLALERILPILRNRVKITA